MIRKDTYIQSGIIAGKLKGVMPAVTPIKYNKMSKRGSSILKYRRERGNAITRDLKGHYGKLNDFFFYSHHKFRMRISKVKKGEIN